MARENFHPKVSYFLRNDKEVRAIIGSSNLSEQGLTSNIEANIILVGDLGESIFRDIGDYLDELWHHRLARDVTEGFISDYRKKWVKFRKRRLRLSAKSLPPLKLAKNYWIFITSPENYKICVQEGLWGVQRTTRMIKEVQPGDLVFFYIKDEKKFAGPFVVTSKVFEDRTWVWPDKEYPLRVTIRPYETYIEVPAGKIAPKLSFVKRKDKWGSHFQGEMRRITREDFKKILMHEKTS